MTRSRGNPVLFCGEEGRLHLLFVVLRGSYWDSATLSGCYSDDLGLDLKHRNGQTHFFGRDPVSGNHEQTEFPKMIRMLSHAASRLASSDVHVFNCSPSTTLDCVQRVSLDWAIKQ